MIAFEVKVNKDGEVDVTRTLNCSHADTDGDYIFDTDNKLIRIQNDNIIKKVEDTIYCMFYEHDLQGCTRQMKKLKSICMKEINSLKRLEEELTDDKKIKYFITQMMMENIK